MAAIQMLLALWLTVVALAFLIGILAGRPQIAGEVFVAPFRFFGWMLRGIFSASGRAAGSVVRDAHRYFYGRWPGWTLVFYGSVFFALFVIGIIVSR